MDVENQEPLEPVASMEGGVLLTIDDDYLVLPPDTAHQKACAMPIWWGRSLEGETAVFDQSTLLNTARQIFEHEYNEAIKPVITIDSSEDEPSTPPRAPSIGGSGESIAVPASPEQGHSAKRRAPGDHRQAAKLVKRAVRKAAA
eukprot:8799289-Heterocapsa_arctica.AAC.1